MTLILCVAVLSVSLYQINAIRIGVRFPNQCRIPHGECLNGIHTVDFLNGIHTVDFLNGIHTVDLAYSA